MQRKHIGPGLLGVLLITLVLAFGAKGDDQVRGMIKARAGDKMIVSGSGGNTIVILTANTRTKDDKGLFGLDKEELADTVLIPGLKVRIEGARGQRAPAYLGIEVNASLRCQTGSVANRLFRT